MKAATSYFETPTSMLDMLVVIAIKRITYLLEFTPKNAKPEFLVTNVLYLYCKAKEYRYYQ